MTEVDPKEISHLLETAELAAREAGEVARERFERPRQLAYKGFRDIVTDADLAAQKRITELIHSRYPNHGFLVEEEDDDLSVAGPVIWVIDPIDGTTNYSRQLPEFSVSVAAAARDPDSGTAGRVLVGAIYDPVRHEMFSAATGRGSRLNGRRVEVSEISDINQALISVDWSHQRPKRQSALDGLNHFGHHVYTIRAIGTAALALAWVAAGRLDGYVNHSLKAWDVAAGYLLIQEAGGGVSDMAGRPTVGQSTLGKGWSMTEHQSACLASNGRIHQPLLRLIKQSR